MPTMPTLSNYGKSAIANTVRLFALAYFNYMTVSFYRPQTKFVKAIFLHMSVSHSVHRGMSTSVHVGIHTPPPRQTPLGADTPLIPDGMHSC